MFEGLERLRDVDLEQLMRGAKAHTRDSRLMAEELIRWRTKYNAGVGAVEAALEDYNFTGEIVKVPSENLENGPWAVEFADIRYVPAGRFMMYRSPTHGRLVIYKPIKR